MLSRRIDRVYDRVSDPGGAGVEEGWLTHPLCTGGY